MKISVNIRVRNPEYYWSKQELDKSKRGEGMSREEWLMINDSKVWKHIDFVAFEYNFEVLSCNDNRNGIFDLRFKSSNDESFEDAIESNIQLDNVTVLEFLGKKDKGYTVVSNELLHQYIGSKKGKDGRYYWYFYIKENTPYNKFSDNIWLSDTHAHKIFDQLQKENKPHEIISIDTKNINLLSVGGSLPLEPYSET